MVRVSRKKLNAIVDNFPGKKILVWGDFILDEYIFGTTSRISREAPVLILSFRRQEFTPGGAGNTVLNLKALGASPIPVGVIGEDEPGERLIESLEKAHISTEHLIRLPSFSTPLKTRILAGEETARKQQILRIDHEERVPAQVAVRNKLLHQLQQLAPSVDALLISDYNYGGVQEELFLQIQPFFRHRPLTLDSRFRLLRFKKVTALTPNESEALHALKIDEVEEEDEFKTIGRQLLHRSEAQAVLLTRGSRGMMLFERRKKPFVIPIFGTTDIVDGTGAGDTVISVFTLALACQASFKEAALLANIAGGLVVMKKGTATVSPNELKEALHR